MRGSAPHGAPREPRAHVGAAIFTAISNGRGRRSADNEPANREHQIAEGPRGGVGRTTADDDCDPQDPRPQLGGGPSLVSRHSESDGEMRLSLVGASAVV